MEITEYHSNNYYHKVVVSGCGAAGFTCALYAIHLGVPKENIIACDVHGTVRVGREDLEANPKSYLHRIAAKTDKKTLKVV